MPKKRAEQPPRAGLPGQAAQEKTGKIPRPQVPAADDKAQIHPCQRQAAYKQSVSHGAVPPAQGAQEAVAHAQPQPQQAGPAEVGRHLRRGRHFTSRRSQLPPCRGSS